MPEQVKLGIVRVAMALVLLAIAGGMVYGLYAMFIGAPTHGAPESSKDISTSVQLPLLAITGVLALIVALALVSVSFALFELSDKTQALGLPEGSVRAVIALCLIVLFAILTIFLYSSLSSPQNKDLTSITGLTFEEVQSAKSSLQVAFVKPPPKPEVKDGYTVYFREPRNPAAEDFAKQLLVMIGTLVTAVASFYFGSRVAAASPPLAESARAAPSLRSASPNPLAISDSARLEIAGDNLDLIKEAKLVLGSEQIIATNVTKNASIVKCDLKLDASLSKGPWDVVVVDGTGKQAKLPAALTLS